MKHIMNDVQTVKSIDAYQNMTNVQKERFRKESGLLIAYIFVPWLLLIPCYFVLSKSHFEDAICTAGVLSVVGLFYRLYKVAKQREFDGEGDMIIYVLRFFFVVYGFGILWQVHWLLGIAFAAAVVWYIYTYFKEVNNYETYTKEVQGMFVGCKHEESSVEHVMVIPVFKVGRKLYRDESNFIDRGKNKILHYGAHTKEQEKEQDEYTNKVVSEALNHFNALTCLEIGQTYTLKRHPIFRSKVIYCAQLTEYRWGNCITDDEGKRVLEEERILEEKLKKEEEKENASKTDE